MEETGDTRGTQLLCSFVIQVWTNYDISCFAVYWLIKNLWLFS